MQVSSKIDPSQKSNLGKVLDTAIRPIDNASTTFFRVAFGLMMAAWAWDYLASGRVTRLYVKAPFNFSYYGFDWITPWPGNGMYFHFLVLMVLAMGIAAGFYYRLCSALFALGFTYFFLLDRTNYQNHYYLIALIGWCLPLLPLHHNVSVDAWRKPAIRSQTLSAWQLWVLQFHIGLPYFFGGIAKLTPDWLLGQPMGMMLATQGDFPVLGSWLAWGPMGLFFSWFGLLFDLLIVPALIWKKTRSIAFVLAVLFHLGNSVLFNIHVFPWFMIVATTLFFAPNWPRTLLAGAAQESSESAVLAEEGNWRWGARQMLLFGLLFIYATFHCVWPLRHNLYGGETSWNERGHFFSWRMMLRLKEVGLGYAVRDPRDGTVANVDHKHFLDPEQAEKFPRDPAMILQLAHHMADEFEKSTQRRPEVYAFVVASLNGRKPQLMIDPNCNLAAEPRDFFNARDYVIPLEEPLRSPPWDIPVEQWRAHIDLPEFEFMKQRRVYATSDDASH